MLNKANIFNIPANYHFFESLAFWMMNSFSQNLEKVKIFLPNRRSCREFKKVLLQQNELKFLPQIKAISEISYEDFFDFLPNEQVQNVIEEILEIRVLGKKEAVFELAKKIQEISVFGSDLKFSQSLRIAENIFDLFEELEREEVDLSQLSAVDDSNLAKHKLVTLEFLQEFYAYFRNSLLRQNILFPQAAQNFVTEKFVKILHENSAKFPIIIAGSTGSIAATRRLIKAVARENFIVTHGFEKVENPRENHSQFFLNELVKFLAIAPENIAQIAIDKFRITSDERLKIANLAMLPSEEAKVWQALKPQDQNSFLSADFAQNISIIQAKDEIEEAQIILKIVAENYAVAKKMAVIANNNKIIDLLILELTRYGFEFNDSRSFPLSKSRLVNFLLQILELEESGFDSHSLLALMKNPFCKISQNFDLLAEFEIKILRQERVKRGLDGIFLKLKEDQKLADFFAEFIADFQRNSAKTIAQKVGSLIEIAENLSGKNWHQLLVQDDAQVEIFEFFEFLRSQNLSFQTDDFLAFLKNSLALVTYSKKSKSEANLQILQNVEARLMNFDLVVISALNEGDFPKIEADNWLGKKIRRDLGIDKFYKRIGQNAYDFRYYLTNPQIFITRCEALNNVELVESPFLARLKILCQKIGLNFAVSKKYLAEQNLPKIIKRKSLAPNPKPSLELRPKKLSITEISKLLQNPYEIYAKKILHLERLREIDYQASYAEFGSFVHKALELHVLGEKNQNFDEIFERYFIAQEAKIIWLPKFQNIFNNFLRDNREFEGLESFCEVLAQISFGDFVIRGKIDRIIVNQASEAVICDYKTGQIPTQKSVKAGIEPQLLIAALILHEGLIGNVQVKNISALNYWKLSALKQSKLQKISQDEAEIKLLIAAAKIGLEKIISYFSDPQNGYRATFFKEESEYKNLARFEGWQSEDFE